MAQDVYGQPALNAAQGNVNTAINTGKQDVQGANTQGQGFINSFNPTDVGGAQLGSGGPQNANDYMSAYAKTVAANPSATSLYSTANKMFNVPQTANQAAYLQNEVNQATPQAYQLARGFDYSEPQVENQINTNLRFLQPEANAAANVAQTNQNLANQYVQAGLTQNQFNLLPIQSYGQYLTQEQNNVFQSLVSKMNAGVQLSSTEMAQLAALQEAAASNATTLGQAGATYAGTLQDQQLKNQYQNIPAGNTLVNTFTGGLYRAQ